jgi:hypothetical protein
VNFVKNKMNKGTKSNYIHGGSMAEKRNPSRIQPPAATHQTSGTQLQVHHGILYGMTADKGSVKVRLDKSLKPRRSLRDRKSALRNSLKPCACLPKPRSPCGVQLCTSTALYSRYIRSHQLTENRRRGAVITRRKNLFGAAVKVRLEIR